MSLHNMLLHCMSISRNQECPSVKWGIIVNIWEGLSQMYTALMPFSGQGLVMQSLDY